MRLYRSIGLMGLICSCLLLSGDVASAGQPMDILQNMNWRSPPASAVVARVTMAEGDHIYEPGTIVIKTGERHLYYYLADGETIRYPIGVGRDGFAGAEKRMAGVVSTCANDHASAVPAPRHGGRTE
jgi:lipoprotein-anchoring transpeptidase ErfK/SrfK